MGGVGGGLNLPSVGQCHPVARNEKESRDDQSEREGNPCREAVQPKEETKGEDKEGRHACAVDGRFGGGGDEAARATACFWVSSDEFGSECLGVSVLRSHLMKRARWVTDTRILPRVRSTKGRVYRG